jgi:hypothetical protein
LTEFNVWGQREIRKGHFFAEDSCNTHYYVKKDSLGQEGVFGLGLPDSSEIKYSYCKIILGRYKNNMERIVYN